MLAEWLIKCFRFSRNVGGNFCLTFCSILGFDVVDIHIWRVHDDFLFWNSWRHVKATFFNSMFRSRVLLCGILRWSRQKCSKKLFIAWESEQLELQTYWEMKTLYYDWLLNLISFPYSKFFRLRFEYKSPRSCSFILTKDITIKGATLNLVIISKFQC